jgi:hypothetical protein
MRVYSDRTVVAETDTNTMEAGFKFCLRYEQTLGKCWLWAGKEFTDEFCYEFTLHAPGDSTVELVMGATYCNVSSTLFTGTCLYFRSS